MKTPSCPSFLPQYLLMYQLNFTPLHPLREDVKIIYLCLEWENSEFAPKIVWIFYKIGSEIGLNFTNISLNTKVGALVMAVIFIIHIHGCPYFDEG